MNAPLEPNDLVGRHPRTNKELEPRHLAAALSLRTVYAADLEMGPYLPVGSPC